MQKRSLKNESSVFLGQKEESKPSIDDLIGQITQPKKDVQQHNNTHTSRERSTIFENKEIKNRVKRIDNLIEKITQPEKEVQQHNNTHTRGSRNAVRKAIKRQTALFEKNLQDKRQKITQERQELERKNSRLTSMIAKEALEAVLPMKNNFISSTQNEKPKDPIVNYNNNHQQRIKELLNQKFGLEK